MITKNQQYLNTGLCVWALRNNRVRTLQYYLIFRLYGKDNAGWVTLTNDRIRHIAGKLGLKESTIKSHIRSLIQLKWLAKEKNKIHVRSIDYVNALLQTSNKINVLVDFEDHLLIPYMEFQAFLAEADKAAHIRANKLRSIHKTYKSRKTGQRTNSCKSSVKVGDKLGNMSTVTGAWAMGLCSEDWKCSKSKVHRLKKVALSMGYAHYQSTWNGEFMDQNLRTWGDVIQFASWMKTGGHDLELTRFRYVPSLGRYLTNDVDIISTKLVLKVRKYRKSRYSHIYSNDTLLDRLDI